MSNSPPPSSHSFNDLFQRAFRDKDSEAYARTVAPFHDSIYRWAYRVVQDRDLAESARSEVFVTLSHNADRLDFESAEPLKVWLYKTAVNKARQQLKRRHSDAALDSVPEPVSPNPGLDELAELGFDRAAVRQAILRLPVEDRMVLALRVEEPRLTRVEMAEILDCTEGAVGPRLTRALDRLSEQLPAEVRERYPRGGH